jgi:hypothetical protein
MYSFYCLVFILNVKEMNSKKYFSSSTYSTIENPERKCCFFKIKIPLVFHRSISIDDLPYDEQDN